MERGDELRGVEDGGEGVGFQVEGCWLLPRGPMSVSLTCASVDNGRTHGGQPAYADLIALALCEVVEDEP